MVDLLLCQALLPGAQAHHGKLCKASGWRLCWCQEHVHIVLQYLHSTTQRGSVLMARVSPPNKPAQLTQTFIRSCMQAFVHSCIHPFIHSFIHSFTGLRHWSLTSDDPAECAQLLHTESELSGAG